MFSKQDSRFDSNAKYYRDMGLIFSDGNLASMHATFSTEHICNLFCKFFKLPMFTQTAGEQLFTNNACPDTLWEEGEIAEVFA